MHEFRAMTQNFSPAVIEMDAAMPALKAASRRDSSSDVVYQ
jgi:hypothetical protein